MTKNNTTTTILGIRFLFYMCGLENMGGAE